MSGNEYINMFSAHLFWDVRKEDVDFDEHAQYIIKESWNMACWKTGILSGNIMACLKLWRWRKN